MSPLISVVIPTRNRLSYLAEAVNSVRAQDLRGVECIVVDDASNDGTFEWLSQQADGLVKPVRLGIHGERSRARNAGLAQARGEFILFLDDDDRLRPHALERLVHAIQDHHDAVIAVGASRFFDDLGHVRTGSHPWLSRKRTIWPEMLAGWCASIGSILFRTEILRHRGGWNAAFAQNEDIELELRVTHTGPAIIVPSVVLEVRLHAGQWRVSDWHDVELAYRSAFVDSLQEHERQHGRTMLRLFEQTAAASDLYRRGAFGEALRECGRMARSAPRAWLSPLCGPGLRRLTLKSAVGALVGRRAMQRVRALKTMAREFLHRNPHGHIHPQLIRLEETAASGATRGDLRATPSV